MIPWRVTLTYERDVDVLAPRSWTLDQIIEAVTEGDERVAVVREQETNLTGGFGGRRDKEAS